MSVRDAVFAVAEPAVQALGFHLVDVEYLKEGSRWVVRAYVYREEGVSLDDCMAVSHALDAALDAADPVKNPYHLEVSSPGAERVLKHDREFDIFAGRWARLNTKVPMDHPAAKGREGDHVAYGRLGPATHETVTLLPVGELSPLVVARTDIKQLRLALASDVPGLKAEDRAASKGVAR